MMITMSRDSFLSLTLGLVNKRKIVFIGGGSAKFVREVIVDLFTYPQLQDSHITLMDVDRERVERSEKLVQKIIEEFKVPATVSATTDQRRAIEGASYVIVTIMVGGHEAYHRDIEIPAQFGVFQTVSDTTGPGGVFRTIRTAPVLKRIAEDMLELAPTAWLLNSANPMSMNMLALERSGLKQTVGLCHSIQHQYRQFARWLDLPADEIHYTAGGINHVNFYLTVTHKGEDLYPRLLAQKAHVLKENPAEITRFELLEYLGYFPAEGPHHQSEYYGWFRKDEKAVQRTAAETYWGYKVDTHMYRDRVTEVEAQIAGKMPIHRSRSVEYAAEIIQALEGGEVKVFYGNVPNRGLIENLPFDSITEVPCLVDRNGIVPGRVGKIPTQLAALMTPHIALHDLAVTGTFAKSRREIYQAIQADPLTSAVLTLAETKELTDAMFAANQEFVAGWK